MQVMNVIYVVHVVHQLHGKHVLYVMYVMCMMYVMYVMYALYVMYVMCMMYVMYVMIERFDACMYAYIRCMRLCANKILKYIEDILLNVALKSPRGLKFFSSIADIRHANYFLELCLQASCSCIGAHAPKTHGRESSNCTREYPIIH